MNCCTLHCLGLTFCRQSTSCPILVTLLGYFGSSGVGTNIIIELLSESFLVIFTHTLSVVDIIPPTPYPPSILAANSAKVELLACNSAVWILLNAS